MPTQLPIVQKRYFVDHRLCEMRNVKNPHDVIRFASSEELNISLAEFDSPQEFDLKLAENAVAISNEFHRDDRFKGFYNEHGPTLSGFTGIWTKLADAARAFTECEIANGVDWGISEHAEWIDAIDRLVSLLFDNGLHLDHDRLMQLVGEAFKA